MKNNWNRKRKRKQEIEKKTRWNREINENNEIEINLETNECR